MTSQRAQAYGRVLATIEDMAASKLFPPEQQRIRDAADTLLFSETISAPGAVEAFEDIEALTQHLIDADRWTEERARGLADDVAGCGPVAQYA
jgi:hypothetical protein